MSGGTTKKKGDKELIGGGTALSSILDRLSLKQASLKYSCGDGN